MTSRGRCTSRALDGGDDGREAIAPIQAAPGDEVDALVLAKGEPAPDPARPG
jgi:hypothetical protein